MGRADDLVLQGNRLMDESRFERAAELFEQALSLDRNNPDLWNSLGVALRSAGRYDEAARCFDRSLEIEPRDKDAS